MRSDALYPRVMFLGMGAVGRSLLGLLMREKLFPTQSIYVADKNETALEFYISNGGSEENTILIRTDSATYFPVLERLDKGDYLLCLAEGNDSVILAGECAERGIHFICASDDNFCDTLRPDSSQYIERFEEYKELCRRSSGLATSVIQFGLNPGLASIFTKKALLDIVETDKGSFVSANRDALRKLAADGEFAALAKALDVTSFAETDLDTTVADITEDADTVYSTWDAPDFYGEMNDKSFVKLGTGSSIEDCLDRLGLTREDIYLYESSNGTVVFKSPGKQVRTRAISEIGYFEGCVVGHEEVFSIYDYYTLRDEEGHIEYAPSVIFVYRPCELALHSLLHGDNKKYCLITHDRILSGEEEMGVYLEGANFSPYYVGTRMLYDPDGTDSPSAYLVAASVLAAIKYVMNHPAEGILLPEHIDAEEILSYVSPYLEIRGMFVNQAGHSDLI